MSIYQYITTLIIALLKMPTKNVNDYLEFNDYHMAVMQAFMIYADFECYNERVSISTNCEDNKPYILLKSEEIPYSFALYTRCLYNKTKNKLDYYTANRCLEKFAKYLKKHIEIICKTKITKKHLLLMNSLIN